VVVWVADLDCFRSALLLCLGFYGLFLGDFDAVFSMVFLFLL
jgi:hypothetical protein